MLAIHIHKLRDQDGNTDVKGENPFEYWNTTIDRCKTCFSDLYSTYDWIDDGGYNNLGNWIEQLATNAGR